MTEFVLALSTWPGQADAVAVAEQMVTARLAACVTVIPGVRSVYVWKGVTTVDTEDQLVIKTTSDRLEALRTWMTGRHPYDLPEFLVVPIVAGGPDYLRWIAASVAPEGPQ